MDLRRGYSFESAGSPRVLNVWASKFVQVCRHFISFAVGHQGKCLWYVSHFLQTYIRQTVLGRGPGSQRVAGLAGSHARMPVNMENMSAVLVILITCTLLHSCCIASPASPSPGSSTPERCHPEDVLLHIRVKRVGKSTAAAGRAAQWEMGGVAPGSRYEARLSLLNEGVGVHEDWRQFHGAVEQDDPAQLISFRVPPLPSGRYTEHLQVYDACGLSASLSAYNEEDRRLRLLSKMNIVVDVE